MGMLLPFPHSWAVRCAKCGHTGTVTATAACSRGQAAAVRIVRPSPALCAGDYCLRAASTDRTQGKPASGGTDWAA